MFINRTLVLFWFIQKNKKKTVHKEFYDTEEKYFFIIWVQGTQINLETKSTLNATS